MGMAREALFNILTHGRFATDDYRLMDGCRVLDLFSGCGALSMEALSRGAAHVILMDIDQEHLDIARQNLRSIGESENATFIRGDSSVPPPARIPCDLIFLDPPYNKGLVTIALKNLIAGKWLAQNAVIVIETAKNEDITIPSELEEIDNRVYGNSRIRICQWNSVSD
jgi:16S rRNA (guanine966-N2)-methyltransferase